MRIWLDDLRAPPDDTWTVCRDAAAFMAAIQYPPEIEEISFDHDLGEGQPTGSELAGILCRRIVEAYPDCTPRWSVHSANPEGARNIASKLETLERFLGRNTP